MNEFPEKPVECEIPELKSNRSTIITPTPQYLRDSHELYRKLTCEELEVLDEMTSIRQYAIGQMLDDLKFSLANRELTPKVLDMIKQVTDDLYNIHAKINNFLMDAGIITRNHPTVREHQYDEDWLDILAVRHAICPRENDSSRGHGSRSGRLLPYHMCTKEQCVSKCEHETYQDQGPPSSVCDV